jgi:hypothetical protein
MAKQIFKLKNWSMYNKSLVERGNVNFWLPENIGNKWSHNIVIKQKGGQKKYSDLSIMTCLIIRTIFNLTLRSTEGFVQSILDINYTGLKCPDYSIISRRAQSLDIEIPHLPKNGPIDVVIDSTGFKIYGEGEWKVRQHGHSKRRSWTKLHIGVNPKTHEIVSGVVTSNKTTDDKVLPKILKNIDFHVDSVIADGAYDKKDCYDFIKYIGAIPIIPPRKDAVISNDCKLIVRNFIIEYINRLGGGNNAKKTWKVNSGYHKRSIAETAMFRLKQIFPDRLKSRKLNTQEVELKIRIAALNKMTFNGMPDSYCIQN